MIKDKASFNTKKRVVVTAAAVAGIVLVISIATIGAAPFSYQQPASDRTGPRITSANIVDGEVRNEDLAPDAVTSDKIRDGEVKAEDLDPAIRGGTAGGFELQVTERSNSVSITEDRFAPLTISVQCEPDEIVTGGGFATNDPQNFGTSTDVFASKKQDNGWSVGWNIGYGGQVITVYAECLKVANEGTTG